MRWPDSSRCDTRDATPEYSLRGRRRRQASDGRGARAAPAGGRARRGRRRFSVAAGRAALRADGFRTMSYLNRDDTNGRDETTLRGKLRFEARGRTGASTSAALYVDLDNGYDAFALDNSFTTRSDRPGRDAQRSTRRLGSSSMATWAPRGWSATTCVRGVGHRLQLRRRLGQRSVLGRVRAVRLFLAATTGGARTLSEDLRLPERATAADDGFGWVAGALRAAASRRTRLQRDDFAGAPLRPPLDERLRRDQRSRRYGEAEWQLAPALMLTAGLRVESRSADYTTATARDFDPDDTMLAGMSRCAGSCSRAPRAGTPR